MSRIEHKQTGKGLELRIKPENEGKFPTYFMGFWLVAWACGWVLAVSSLLGDPIGFNSLFVLVWTIFWTFGGLFVGLWLVWKTNGFEQIIVNSIQLKIKHNIFGFGPVKVYATDRCVNLRAAGYFGSHNNNQSILQQIGMKGGVVAIDAVDESIRFGVALEESEAKEVVELLRSYIKT